MSKYTKKGTRFHSIIARYLEDGTDNGSCRFIEIIREIVAREEWTFRFAELAVSAFGLNGRIDAVFYDERRSEFVLIDWKCTSRLPAASTIVKYENLGANLRNSDKFFHRNIVRYIAQLNLYAVLLRRHMNLSPTQNVQLNLFLVKENKRRTAHRRIRCRSWPQHDVLSYAHAALFGIGKIKQLRV